MSDKIVLEERVLDGTQVGPLTVEIDTKEFTGTVELQDSFLDGTGSEIVIEHSDSLGVVGIDDLVEVKSEIDKSVNKAEHSVAESQRQIDKANQTIAALDAISTQITTLVDSAKTAATTADNRAHDADVSANTADARADAALVSQNAAKASETAADASEAAALASQNAAKASEDAAQSSENDARGQASIATSKAAEAANTLVLTTAQQQAAKAAQTAAEAARDSARLAERNSANSAAASARSQSAALASQNAAKVSEDAAQQSEDQAKAYAESMTQSVADARAARDAAQTAQANAETAQANAESEAAEATTQAGRASTSASEAKDSEDAALVSQNAAKASEDKAKASETAASQSETAAKAAQAAASASQTAANSSAATASTKATEAANSATAAANSATAAGSSANDAAASAAAAATSEDNASDSEIAAKASETASAASESAASDSEAASKASETAAKASEVAAKASETASKVSENNAKASETAAAASATRASQSMTSAQTAASQALANKNASDTSANSAAQSATNAADSEMEAEGHASDASASELNAKTSESAAKASQTAAKASEDAAEAAEAKAKAAQTAAAEAQTAAEAAQTASETAATASRNYASGASTSAADALTHEQGAKAARDEAEHFAEELRKGSVYMGTWNPNDGAYPAKPVTNARWDVKLNQGQLAVDFDGKEWNWGDRLIFILDEDKFDIIDSGTGVTSVNGNTGAVTVTPENIGAVKKSGDTVGNLVVQEPANARLIIRDSVNANAGEGPRAVFATPHGQDVEIKHILRDGETARGAGYSLRVQKAEGNTGGTGADFEVEGNLYENGNKRVYSEANKPSADDVGAVSKSGGQINGNLITTGYQRANNVQLSTLTSNNKAVLTGTAKTLTIANSDIDSTNINSDKLTHKGAKVYTEADKPTPYDIGAVGTTDSWYKYTRDYSVNKDTTAELLNYEGKPLSLENKSYYIRAYTKATGTDTGAVYYLKGSEGTTNPTLTTVAQIGLGSNHPEVYLENNVVKLRTGHANSYTVAVIIEEVAEDCNPWLDITQAYSTRNPVPWDKVSSKPTQAIRWPTWDEVTSKPTQAIRWPTFAEVTDKPAYATRWPNWGEVGGTSYLKEIGTHLQVGGGKWLRAATDGSGFLPATQGTAGKSYLGTAGWWFQDAYVANYHGKTLEIEGTTKIDGELSVGGSISCTKSGPASNTLLTIPNAPQNSVYYINWVPGQDIISFRRTSTTTNNSSEVNIYGSLREKGERVYSPNNKPTLADIGALGKTEKAADTTNFNGKTYAQVIADARNGLTAITEVWSKTSSDSRYLGKSGTAVNADAVGGIDPSRIVYGTNQFALTAMTDFNNNRKSGFIEMSNRVSNNKPGRDSSWVWGWQASHSGNSDSNKYGAQLVINQDSQLYYRVQNSSGIGTWATAYSTANKPTAADVGLSNIDKIDHSSLRITSDYGFCGIGPLNTALMHFQTDRAAFYFNKPIRANGYISVYEHSDTKLDSDGKIYELGQRVYSPNNKPRVADISQPNSTTKALQLTAGDWTDLLTKEDFKEGSGVYQILVNYSSYNQGGGAYSEGYTGQLFWYEGNTNNDNIAEIPLHHMGHADSGEYIYLRTAIHRGNSGDQSVQIKCNRTHNAAVSYLVRLVKII